MVSNPIFELDRIKKYFYSLRADRVLVYLLVVTSIAYSSSAYSQTLEDFLNPGSNQNSSPAHSPIQTSTPSTGLPGTNTPGTPTGPTCLVTPGESCDASTSGDPTNNVNGYQPLNTVGNPVSLITGNKFELETDYSSINSRLAFYRYYNSGNAATNLGLGQGWTSTYSTKLKKLSDGGYTIIQASGQHLHFRNAHVSDDGVERWLSDSPSNGFIYIENEKYYWELPDGRTLTFNGSFLIHIDFPGFQYLSLTYRQGQLFEVRDEANRTLQFDYYPVSDGLSHFNDSQFGFQEGYFSKITLPDGSSVEFDYDQNHNLSRARYSDGTSRVFEYANADYPNHLTALTDRKGVKYATWEYDAKGRAISSSHVGGVQSVELEYHDAEDIGGVGTTFVSNSLGQVSTYEWTLNQQTNQALLLSSEGPGCSSCPAVDMSYTYNDFYQVTSALDKFGRGVGYEYDELGRIISTTEFDDVGVVSKTTRVEYQANSFRPTLIAQPSVSNSGEHIKRIIYTDDGLVSTISEEGYAPSSDNYEVFEPIERITKFTYSDGRIKSIDGPRSDVRDITEFEYDELGRLVSIGLPSSPKITLSDYDEHGRARKYRLGTQSPMLVEYDLNGNIIELTHRKQSVNYHYDAKSRLVGITNPNEKYIALQYDDADRLTRFTDEIGLVSEYVSDTEGRLVSHTNYGPDGQSIRALNYVFDAKGRLQSLGAEVSNFSEGSDREEYTDFEYDYLGRVSSVARSRQQDRTQFSYDIQGRLTNVNQENTRYSGYEFDNKGQDIGYVDARGNRTRFIKDDFGRVVTLISQDSGITHYEYDEASNRTRKTNADNQVTSYQWDSAGRLIQKKSADGVTNLEYASDSGKLILAANTSTTERFIYDHEYQLTQHSREIDGRVFTTVYLYDEKGKLAKRQLPDGQTLHYHYHQSGPSIGELRAITRNALLGLSQETLIGEIDTERRDGRTGYVSHNGVVTEHTYLPDGSISGISVSNTLQLEYKLDDDGKIVGIVQDGYNNIYRYNSGNLVEASTAIGSFQYRYDEESNRVESIEALQNKDTKHTEYFYSDIGEGNKLRAIFNTGTGKATSLAYNQSGSPIISSNGYRYVYNVDQRPIKVYQNDDLLAEYSYNTFGERIKKVVYTNNSQKVTYFLYDGHSLTAEISADDNAQSQYVYLKDGTPVLKLVKNEVYSIHSDHLGTPRKMTNAAAGLVWDADYSPYGKATVNVDDVKLNLRLPGQYEDAETGTHYNYYRDYDPATGRYITPDPIGLQGGNNLYAYLKGDPLNSSDTLGLADDDLNITTTDGVEKPIASASFSEKAGVFFQKFGTELKDQGSQKVKDFLTPANITLMAGMGLGIAAIQLVPGLNVVFNTIFLGWSYWELGSHSINFIKKLAQSVVAINSATTASALCLAAKDLAASVLQLLELIPGPKLAKIGAKLGAASIYLKGLARKNNVDPDKPDVPCPNSNCNTQLNDLHIPKSDLPSRRPNDYSYEGENVRGPKGGLYTKLEHTFVDEAAGGQVYSVFTNNGRYYTFKNGVKVEVRNPNPSVLGAHITGLAGEMQVATHLDGQGYRYRIGSTPTRTGSVDDNIGGYMGRRGIDGIYKNDAGQYVIVEVKSSEGMNIGHFNNTASGKQMSYDWIFKRLTEDPLVSKEERDIIMAGIGNGGTLLVKAEVRNVSGSSSVGMAGDVTYKEIAFDGRKKVRVDENSSLFED